MDIHVQHLASLCQIGGDEIEDHKHKVDTNHFVSEIHQIWKDLMLLDSPNVHPPLKNNQRKKANFKCKWCISLLIEHALIIWDKIKTLQVRQQARKHQMREVNTTEQHTKKKTRKNKKKRTHTLSTAIFTRYQFASMKNLASHASEATTSAIGPQSIRTHPMIPCNKKYSYSIISNVFFEIIWNLDEYCKLILKSLRLRPLLLKFFITGSIFW